MDAQPCALTILTSMDALLYLDLDVDARRQIQLHERIDRLRR
jgi:hypothetical protein